MILEELFESEEKPPGTYAAAIFDKDSQKIVADYIRKNEIPNSTKPTKIHCTIIYSREHIPNFKITKNYDTPLKCVPNGLVVWKTQPDDDGNTKNCLVLKLKCPEIVKRHEELMQKYPMATYDYPEFKVHMTLSYDIDDMTKDDFPDFDEELYLSGEITSPLDTVWAKKNTKK